MSLPASQPARGLSSLGKRMCTTSMPRDLKLSVRSRIARIFAVPGASFPWLLTPRPNADSGFISTYLAPTSTANSHRAPNSPGSVSMFGVDSKPCSMPAAASLRVVSSVVANEDTLPRNLPWLSGRKPSKLTFTCTAPDLARCAICSSLASVALVQIPSGSPSATTASQMARRSGCRSEAHIHMHRPRPGQVRDLLVAGERGVGADPQRQPECHDGVADGQEVWVREWLPAGERHPLDPGPQEPGQHLVRDVLPRHVLAPVTGRDEAVRAVQVAPLGDLDQGFAAVAFHRRPEVAGAGVRVDDQ